MIPSSRAGVCGGGVRRKRSAMKQRYVLAVGILFLLAVTLSWAQAPASAPKYDFTKEVTVKGVVQEVKDFQCPVSGGMGAHLVVKTDKGVVTVHLALSKFLSEYGFGFA